METSQFEAKKVALKQTKDGHVLTLAIHPDESPDEILRDFVGARYMVVMVRLADSEEPMDRQDFVGSQAVKVAGILCRDRQFWEFLYEQGYLFERNEEAAKDWLCSYLDIQSRADIKINLKAREAFSQLNEEFKKWKS
jgi:hypothetical protein